MKEDYLKAIFTSYPALSTKGFLVVIHCNKYILLGLTKKSTCL